MGREKEREGGELKGAAGAAGNADDAFAVVVKFCSARKDIMCDAAAFFAAFKLFPPEQKRGRSQSSRRVHSWLFAVASASFEANFLIGAPDG